MYQRVVLKLSCKVTLAYVLSQMMQRSFTKLTTAAAPAAANRHFETKMHRLTSAGSYVYFNPCSMATCCEFYFHTAADLCSMKFKVFGTVSRGLVGQPELPLAMTSNKYILACGMIRRKTYEVPWDEQRRQLEQWVVRRGNRG